MSMIGIMFLFRVITGVDGSSKGSHGLRTCLFRCARRAIRPFNGQRILNCFLRGKSVRTFRRNAALARAFTRISFSPRNHFNGNFRLVASANSSDRFISCFHFGRYQVRVRTSRTARTSVRTFFLGECVRLLLNERFRRVNLRLFLIPQHATRKRFCANFQHPNVLIRESASHRALGIISIRILINGGTYGAYSLSNDRFPT